ncbi:hypothetical protein [Actinopolyspora halophila]|uniref:hypothetical protein n=1 Tax=Actinopolyspora halophila TaxID=1850 RepID=UPI0012FA1676|nr:hypothetical protein [Actinopolyspora halophila]
MVEDAVVPPEPDEEFELDLEELDDEEDGLTEEERAEFLELLSQRLEIVGQVWLHFSLETNHPDSSAAEAAFVSLLEELEAGLSTEEVQYEIRSVEATDRDTHVAEAVCRTFEKDATKVLDDLMNSMPHGVWSSDTRPWDLGRKEHIVLRWRPPETAAHDSRGLVVHARKGPPEEHYKQIFQDAEDSEAEHEDAAGESSS